MTNNNTKKTALKRLFNNKHFLLTASNMPDDSPAPEHFMTLLQAHKMFTNIRTAIISKELHESGAPHFHAFLSFHKRKSLYKKDSFDFLFNKPTHVKACSSPRQAAAYVAKLGDFAQAGVPLVAVKSKALSPKEKIIHFLKDKDRVLTDLALISSRDIDKQLYDDAHKVDRWFVRSQA